MIRHVLVLCMGCAVGGCDDSVSDPCDETQAPAISIQVKASAEGLDPTTQPTISSDKVPCGGAVKGEFDLPGSVNADGSFLSHWAGYNLHNTKDVVRIHYSVPGMGSGMRILTYGMLEPYDGSTYILDLNSELGDAGDGSKCTLNDLKLWYQEDPTRFLFCQDLAWAVVHDDPPEKGGALKSVLWADMKDRYQNLGAISTSELQDRDIVMFDNDPEVILESPAHYAVSYGGQLWQILHWKDGCDGGSYGELSGPVTIESFYQARMLTSPCTGQTGESKPYIVHAVFREK